MTIVSVAALEPDSRRKAKVALAGLARALHAKLADVIRIQIDPKTGKVNFEDSIIAGDLGDVHSKAWANHLSSDRRRDLFFAAIKRRLLDAASGSTGVAYERSQLVPDDQWYGSEFVTEVKEPLNLDECAASAVPDIGAGRAEGSWIKASLHRAHKQPKFTREEVQLIHQFLIGIRPLLQAAAPDKRPSSERLLESLSPRQRDIVHELLSGRSGKQIAAKLKLAESSVQTYCKRLYRQLGVSGRPELVALFQRNGGNGNGGGSKHGASAGLHNVH